ncbi:hypothetical protein CYMTET_4709 [Cymbomonas tetramitiformis]|uniref:Uncharacterized protein n=1 Tax=Cymbomonas tetramitiformis TaxID=36881 RepID=A0AAE0H0N1_9CHLO|nr:hypothetical protein CYMTET_4709 [Cymbomonas tetramitiformis]
MVELGESRKGYAACCKYLRWRHVELAAAPATELLHRAKSEPDCEAWSTFSTFSLGAPARPLPNYPRGRILAAQDITELLASSSSAQLPLSVTRAYERSPDGRALVVRFNLTSTADTPLQLGGVGFPLPESAGHPPAGIQSVVWNDPHVGGQHGFVEFVRVVDDEATLLVTPAEHSTTPLEGWRPMLEDLGNGDAYEWLAASSAWAEEWAENKQWPFLNMSDTLKQTYPSFAEQAQTPWPSTDGKHGMPHIPAASKPWNPPTSASLAPSQTLSFALRLQLAESGPRSRNKALEDAGEPVMHGVPGYVLSTDMQSAQLFVQPPRGATTEAAAFEQVDAGAKLALTRTSPTPGGFDAFTVAASGRGRARVRVSFSDGTSAIAHYYVLPPLSQQVAKLGAHLADVAWLPRDFIDPFGRSASVMPWDRSACEDGNPCGHILNDARAYDVGLSDDAGGGNPLCLASKVRAAPTQHEAGRIDEYIQWTLYGIKPDTAKPPFKSLQIREDEHGDVDGIRMTLFYYAANMSNHTSGHFEWNYTEADKCHAPFGGPTWCMTENMANATYRRFNYPHQIASYWAMYHVARHYGGLKTRMPWTWYLERAAKTALQIGTQSTGLMDGTVVREVLEALKREGEAGNATFADFATRISNNMQVRQQNWAKNPYPYGSEFGFDTTGQEEVVVWNLYFGNVTVAKKTVDHILSYMRSSPTWAYNGGSRSWGDIGNNGKYLATFGTGIQDRGQMHYRSGLNMIPLMEYYRMHPDDFFLLEISMGAITGQMCNIDESGATSMMWHAVPHVNDFDPHSGDYGLGFFGNALESGAYFVQHPQLGSLCFLCDAGPGAAEGNVEIVPRDAYRLNAFIEPLTMYLQVESGTFSSLTLMPSRLSVVIRFAAIDASAAPYSKLRLRVTKTSDARPWTNFVLKGAPLVRGAYEITPAEPGEVTEVVVNYGLPPASASHLTQDSYEYDSSLLVDVKMI